MSSSNFIGELLGYAIWFLSISFSFGGFKAVDTLQKLVNIIAVETTVMFFLKKFGDIIRPRKLT